MVEVWFGALNSEMPWECLSRCLVGGYEEKADSIKQFSAQHAGVLCLPSRVSMCCAVCLGPSSWPAAIQLGCGDGGVSSGFL